ncbi:hypothetical protein GCM10009588_26450 [Microbacterium phyllosphaerae]
MGVGAGDLMLSRPDATDDTAKHDALPDPVPRLRGTRSSPCGDWAQCSSVRAIVYGRRVSPTLAGHRKSPVRIPRRHTSHEGSRPRRKMRLWIVGIAIYFVM